MGGTNKYGNRTINDNIHVPYGFGQWSKEELKHIKVPSAEEKNIRSVITSRLNHYYYVCSDQFGLTNTHFSAICLAIKNNSRTKWDLGSFCFEDTLIYYQTARIKPSEIKQILTMRRERG